MKETNDFFVSFLLGAVVTALVIIFKVKGFI